MSENYTTTKKVLSFFVFLSLFFTVKAQIQMGETFSVLASGYENHDDLVMSDDGNRFAYSNRADSIFVYDYDATSNQWLLNANITFGSNTVVHARIGLSFSADANVLAISHLEDTSTNLGKCKIYQYNGSTWLPMGSDIMLTPQEAEIGNVALSADGTRLIMGSPFYAISYTEKGGRAIMFEYDGTDWVQLGNYLSNNAVFGNWGDKTDISGDGSTIIVCDSYGHMNDNGSYCKVFRYDGTDWMQLGSELYSDHYYLDFGTDISISNDGNRIAVGAPECRSNTCGDDGEVLIYDYNGTDWVQVGQTLFGNDYDHFGCSVSMSNNGNRVAAAALNYTIIFDYDGQNWLPIKTLTRPDATGIGCPIQLSGDGTTLLASTIEPFTPFSIPFHEMNFYRVNNLLSAFPPLVESQIEYHGFRCSYGSPIFCFPINFHLNRFYGIKINGETLSSANSLSSTYIFPCEGNYGKTYFRVPRSDTYIFEITNPHGLVEVFDLTSYVEADQAQNIIFDIEVTHTTCNLRNGEIELIFPNPNDYTIERNGFSEDLLITQLLPGESLISIFNVNTCTVLDTMVTIDSSIECSTPILESDIAYLGFDCDDYCPRFCFPINVNEIADYTIKLNGQSLTNINSSCWPPSGGSGTLIEACEDTYVFEITHPDGAVQNFDFTDIVEDDQDQNFDFTSVIAPSYCNSNNGAVSLDFPSADYSSHWSNGINTLSSTITDLAPGTYDVSIVNFETCNRLITSYTIDEVGCAPNSYPVDEDDIETYHFCGDSDIAMCLPIAPFDIINYEVYLNGAAIGPIGGCNFDTIFSYSTFVLPSFFANDLNIDDWTVDGITYTGTVESIADLLIFMNRWNPQGQWAFNSTTQNIVGKNTGVEVSSLYLSIGTSNGPSDIVLGLNTTIQPQGTIFTIPVGNNYQLEIKETGAANGQIINLNPPLNNAGVNNVLNSVDIQIETCSSLGIIALDINNPNSYTISWSNGATTASISNLSAGNYTVTITDNNCINFIETYEVTADLDTPNFNTIISTANIVNVDCGTTNTGAIELTTAPANLSLYDFAWSNGESTLSIDDLIDGTYFLTITDDENGCSTVESFEVETETSGNNSIAVVQQVQINNENCGAADGELNLILNSNIPNLNVLWSNGATTPMITGLSAGNYAFTVTDNAGCYFVAQNVELNNYEDVLVVPTVTDATCNGNDGEIALEIYYNTQDATILWDNGASVFDLINLESGTYSYTVTSNSGCEISDQVIVGGEPLCNVNLSGYIVDINTHPTNCTQDAQTGDIPYIFLKATGNNGEEYNVFTDAAGYYELNVLPGTYTLTIFSLLGGLDIVCPQSQEITINNTQSNQAYSDNNFYVTPNYDLLLDMSTKDPRPGYEFDIELHYTAFYSNMLSNPSILFMPQEGLEFVSASIPEYSIESNGIVFDLSNHLVQNGVGTIKTTFSVPLTFDLGDILTNTAIIRNDLNGEANIDNNFDTLMVEVVDSYDPNDKSVTPSGVDEDGKIELDEETFIYRINFQNFGTAPAITVLIRDTIDVNLDMCTFDILDYSHPMSMSATKDRELSFTFDDIWLPSNMVDEEGSKGYVIYKIKRFPNDNLTFGDQITNTASIYFDFNEAVVTNTVVNTFHDFTTVPIKEVSIENINQIEVHPNPFSDVVTIDYELAESDEIAIELYDIKGVLKATLLPQQTKNAGKHSVVYDDALAAGVYFIKIKTSKGEEVRKVIKQ